MNVYEYIVVVDGGSICRWWQYLTMVAVFVPRKTPPTVLSSVSLGCSSPSPRATQH